MYTVTTSGTSFTLVGSDGSRRDDLRLGDAVGGATCFLVTDHGGAEVTARVQVLVPPGEALAFTAASASRTWRRDCPAGHTPQLATLRPEGSGTSLDAPATWQTLPDSRLQFMRNRREVTVGKGGGDLATAPRLDSDAPLQ